MSVKIMSLVWERAPYTAGSLLVLLALADWSNDDGLSWPSISRIADKTRLERRSVQYIIRKLKKDDMIDIEEGRGRGNQHRYQIKVQNLRLLPEIKGAIDDIEKVQLEAEKVQSTTQKVQPIAPDPLEEPLADPSIEPSETQPPFSGQLFLTALADFDQHRKEKKVRVTPTARRLLYRKLERMGEAAATAALEYSTSQNWTGVFPERANNGSNQSRHESTTERNARNLRENAEYIRSLSDGDSETDRQDPIGLLASGF